MRHAVIGKYRKLAQKLHIKLFPEYVDLTWHCIEQLKSVTVSVLGNKVKQCSIFGQKQEDQKVSVKKKKKKIRKINKIRKSFSLLFPLGRHFGGKFNVCKQMHTVCTRWTMILTTEMTSCWPVFHTMNPNMQMNSSWVQNNLQNTMLFSNFLWHCCFLRFC